MEAPDYPVTPPSQPGSETNGPPLETAAKADLGQRAIALIIDSAIAFVLGVIPIIGGLLGAAYMVARDGLEFDFMNRRSVGKQLMKLRPVRLDGKPMDIETSVRRNWMFGLGAVTTMLLWIPILGWALIPFVALAAFLIGIYEVFKVFTDDQGRRWGDKLGNTRVIESEA